jgi:hypothetical protein
MWCGVSSIIIIESIFIELSLPQIKIYPIPKILPFLCSLASQFRQSLCPLCVIDRFSRSEVDSQGAKVCCAGRLRRIIKDIGLPSDFEIDKTGGYDRSLELCFQQSAGNSARPQIDVTFGTLWNCFLDQDIADLQTTTRLEDPRHFLQGCGFIGDQVQDAIRDHNISPAIVNR